MQPRYKRYINVYVDMHAYIIQHHTSDSVMGKNRVYKSRGEDGINQNTQSIYQQQLQSNSKERKVKKLSS